MPTEAEVEAAFRGLGDENPVLPIEELTRAGTWTCSTYVAYPGWTPIKFPQEFASFNKNEWVIRGTALTRQGQSTSAFMRQGADRAMWRGGARGVRGSFPLD
jgi:hypothetical protein